MMHNVVMGAEAEAVVAGHAAVAVDPTSHDPAGDGVGIPAELTVRGGVGHLGDHIRRHHVAVDDGSASDRRLGRLLLVCLVFAAVTLLVSHLTFGPRDTYLPDLASKKQIPAILVVGALMLLAAFLSVAAWHSVTDDSGAGRRFAGSVTSTLMAVAMVNAFIGFSLLSTAALLRTRALVFARSPSLAQVPLGDSDICLALGLTVVLACVLLLVVALLAPRHRGVAALLALAPGLACAVAYVLADRDVLTLNEWAATQLALQSSEDQIRFLVATPAEHIATAPLLVLVLASAAGIGLLVSFGAVEFVDAKTKLSRWLLGGRQVSATVVAALIAMFVVTVAAARAGWVPDGEGAVQAFFKTAPDSWILAAVLAGAGVSVVRASRRRPFEARHVRVVVAVACVSLVAGQVVQFLSVLLLELAGPLVAGDTPVGRFIFARLPTWSLWAQDWVTLLVAAALGVWGVYRVVAGHERSDRVVFAVAFAAVTFPLRSQIIADTHWASKDLWSFTAATPEQIALCAVAIVAVAALVRRPVLDNRTAALVVTVLFLVMVADAVVPNAFSARVFQLLLIAPFAYQFMFDSAESHRDPRRGAVTVAAIGLLFLAEAAAIAAGLLNSDAFKFSGISAFLQLAAPLALVMLCATTDRAALPAAAPGVAPAPPIAVAADPDSAEPDPTFDPSDPHAGALDPVTDPGSPVGVAVPRRWPSVVAATVTSVFGVFLVAAVVFTMIDMPGKPERGVYRIDLATIPARYQPTQAQATADTEQVELRTGDATSILVVHHGNIGGATTLISPCSAESVTALFGAAPTAPVVDAGTIAGMAAQATSVSNPDGEYRLTCATDLDDVGIGRVIIIAETGQTALSADMTAILDGLTFSKASLPTPPADS
jgi:hypothetical protein